MFADRSRTKRKGLAMEVIAQLRAEREALVGRLEKIDKMLRQYEEWGQEAQRLLSVTGVSPSSSGQTIEAAANFLPHTLEEHGASAVETPFQQSLRPTQMRKTPIAEFEAAVIDVLRHAGQPMDRVALYDALTERGIIIGDGDRDKELNALSARVYRMAKAPNSHISSERGQGYSWAEDGAGDTAAEERAKDEGDGSDLI